MGVSVENHNLKVNVIYDIWEYNFCIEKFIKYGVMLIKQVAKRNSKLV